MKSALLLVFGLCTFVNLANGFIAPFNLGRISDHRARDSTALRAPAHRILISQNPRSVLHMAATQGEKKVGTDEKKLKLGRYELFPKKNMTSELDLTKVMHNGGQDLRKLYHESDRLLIVEYYKDRCSMCRVLRPLMHKVIAEFEDRVHFAEVEVLENKDVIVQAGLRAVPTVHVFYRGMIVDHFNGLHAKSKLRNRFQSLLDAYEHATESDVEKAFEKSQAKKKLKSRNYMMYPMKHIYATGRVLYPAHWNSLFHTEKNIERNHEKQSSLNIFLDNGNCLGDDGHEMFYVAALRKGKIPGSGLLGRISDGESNIQYGELSDDGTVDVAVRDKAGRVVHQICDATGCTLIVKHSEE